MNKDLPQFAVTALVFIARDAADPSGASLLLVRQSYGKRYWSLPGGSMEAGESVEQAAVREVKEETGLDVRLTRLVGVYSKPAEGALAICFEGEVTGGAPSEATGAPDEATGEIVEWRYFPADELPTPVRAHLRQRVADWRRGGPGAVWRRQ
jgi:ADP-ribose pyrophosphatase YjhB (NUDIX family)